MLRPIFYSFLILIAAVLGVLGTALIRNSGMTDVPPRSEGTLKDRTVKIVADTGARFAPVKSSTYHFNRGLNLVAAIDHIGCRGDGISQGIPSSCAANLAGAGRRIITRF